MKRFLLISAGLLLSILPLCAQTFTADQARQDLNTLVDGIKTYNAALYTYNPEYDQQANQVLENIGTEEVSLFEHFNMISQLCALSNEGHFGLGDWSDAVHKGIPDNTFRYLPMGIRILDGRIYVWEAYSDEGLLEKGDEILELNGKTASDILREFYKVYPSDGQITTYVDRTVEIGFPWLYYFYIDRPETHEFAIRKPDGSTQKIAIRALTRDEQVENYRAKNGQPEPVEESISDLYELEVKENYALLTLKSFDRGLMEKYDINPGKLYKSIFEEVEGVKNLIVDLRGNTGGRNEFADDMVPFILRDDHGNEFLKKTLSWEGRERTYKLPKPDKNLYAGNVYVLVDGRTWSAGSTLARYLKEYAGAVIIGEETGTRYEGFAAGSKQTVELSNSGLQVHIPRYHIFFPESALQKTTNRGVMPDHSITYTIEDLIAERDLHLEKARSLIAGNN